VPRGAHVSLPEHARVSTGPANSKACRCWRSFGVVGESGCDRAPSDPDVRKPWLRVAEHSPFLGSKLDTSSEALNNLAIVMTLDEVPQFLKVHPSTVYPLYKRIPAFKLGSDWHFSGSRSSSGSLSFRLSEPRNERSVAVKTSFTFHRFVLCLFVLCLTVTYDVRARRNARHTRHRRPFGQQNNPGHRQSHRSHLTSSRTAARVVDSDHDEAAQMQGLRRFGFSLRGYAPRIVGKNKVVR
jgi:hypothetical protein